ncbi:alpha/beta fold hydrolase [Salinibius halmophilus]|uniref:alpha/beta fold hydrolase n=1 Tax=Salinibius halmophilus TaxID=1853216 RepID=UPI000E66A2C0|nr:alpha/beta fold hydrolase [Salinibius halmophilus]
MSLQLQQIEDPKFGHLTQYSWLAEAPIGTVVFCHGVQEHLGRYERLAEALNALQVSLIGIDHPGHGKSHKNGLIADVQTQDLHDLAQVQLSLLKTVSGPVVLMGHSMGAFIACYAAQMQADQHCQLTGLALLSSAGDLNPIATLGYPLLKASSYIWQQGGLPEALCFLGFNRKTENRTPKDWLCSNPEAVAQNLADPFCNIPLPSRTAVALARAGKHAFTRKALAHIPDKYPILMTAGKGDPLSYFGKTVARSARYLARVRHQPVSVWLYNEARHEILHEAIGEQYAKQVARWAADCLTGEQSLNLEDDSTKRLG